MDQIRDRIEIGRVAVLAVFEPQARVHADRNTVEIPADRHVAQALPGDVIVVRVAFREIVLRRFSDVPVFGRHEPLLTAVLVRTRRCGPL